MHVVWVFTATCRLQHECRTNMCMNIFVLWVHSAVYSLKISSEPCNREVAQIVIVFRNHKETNASVWPLRFWRSRRHRHTLFSQSQLWNCSQIPRKFHGAAYDWFHNRSLQAGGNWMGHGPDFGRVSFSRTFWMTFGFTWILSDPCFQSFQIFSDTFIVKQMNTAFWKILFNNAADCKNLQAFTATTDDFCLIDF